MLNLAMQLKMTLFSLAYRPNKVNPHSAGIDFRRPKNAHSVLMTLRQMC